MWTKHFKMQHLWCVWELCPAANKLFISYKNDDRHSSSSITFLYLQVEHKGGVDIEGKEHVGPLSCQHAPVPENAIKSGSLWAHCPCDAACTQQVSHSATQLTTLLFFGTLTERTVVAITWALHVGQEGGSRGQNGPLVLQCMYWMQAHTADTCV